MADVKIAKLSQTTTGQVVQLPEDFAFDGDEVYATRDEDTGDRMLSSAGGSSSVCISVITRAELVYGIQALATEHELTTTGRPIGDRDVMIAAHAISLGVVLVTNNTRHHGRLAPLLQIENWVDA